MSTEFPLYKDGDKEVGLVERSCKFDLDLYGYFDDADHSYFGAYSEIPAVSGPQGLTADEALKMAATIIYAVWCSYPDKANSLVDRMSTDIPTTINRLREE